jgi:hypothetical protein
VHRGEGIIVEAGKGIKMEVFKFELRPGVELEIDLALKVNHAPSTTPCMEIPAIIESRLRKQDELIARYTREYLQAHITKAFDSLEPPKAC